MASTYLTISASTPTSAQIGTMSFWVKRSGLSSTQILMAWDENSTTYSRLYFNDSDRLAFKSLDNGNNYGELITNRLFRDTSAWYHIVCTIDTTNGTSGDRIKYYVNGVRETSFDTESQPSQNRNLKIGEASNYIGRHSSSYYFDGSMTHLHYVDGTAYQASTFGESDSVSSIWKPKTSPTISEYGLNGVFLKFENSGAMGTDSSGKGNTYTVSGNLTQNVDTPSNNFITINPLDNYYPACTFSNGNTTVATGNNYSYCQSTIYVNTGKYYWEVKAVSKSSGADEFMIGIQGKSATATNSPAQSNNGITYYKDGDTYGFGGGGTSYGNSYTVGDIIGVALDCDNNKLYFSKNGTWQNSGDPTSGATGTGALAITDPNDVPQGGYSPVGGAYTSVSHTLSFNFGQGYFGTTAVASAGTAPSEGGIFEYDCPSGYQALCTKGINSF